MAAPDEHFSCGGVSLEQRPEIPVAFVPEGCVQFLKRMNNNCQIAQMLYFLQKVPLFIREVPAQGLGFHGKKTTTRQNAQNIR
jgi:hypothetical protein